MKKINTNKLNFTIMIRLPKKIKETIKSELTQDYSVIRRVYIDSHIKEFKTHLIVLRIQGEKYVVLRYFGDDSYSFTICYEHYKDANEELLYKLEKLL